MSDRRAEERDYVERVDTSHGSQFSTTELAIQAIQKLQARLVAYERVAEARRDTLARRFRDWLHETPLSKCGMSADECPDWPLAYELADLALSALDTERKKDA